MRVLDLFSGIGGFSLGLERAGMRTVAFCEIDPYCRAVLARHWSGVPIFGDIRSLNAEAMAHPECSEWWQEREARRAAGVKLLPPGEESAIRPGGCGPIDLICGGFPCQDISVAGKGAGLAGARSGLWSEYARLIGELRPKYVIVENVSALLSRGLEQVLADLASVGYDAEWHCIPASYVGAPHRRDRIWIVAYPDSSEREARRAESIRGGSSTERDRRTARDGAYVADASSGRSGRRRPRSDPKPVHNGSLAHSTGIGCEPMVESECRGADQEGTELETADPGITPGREWWSSEPDVGRVAHGVPSRVDRLRALGNAVVPQVVEVIGRAIMNLERQRDH